MACIALGSPKKDGTAAGEEREREPYCKSNVYDNRAKKSPRQRTENTVRLCKLSITCNSETELSGHGLTKETIYSGGSLNLVILVYLGEFRCI